MFGLSSKRLPRWEVSRHMSFAVLVSLPKVTVIRGSSIEDARGMLWQLRKSVLHAQIEDISQAIRRCDDCKRTRPIHDYLQGVFDTLLGPFRIRLPRLRTCSGSA